jgi:hypothetical protein
MEKRIKSPIKYRIFTADGRVKYAGTDSPSWFTLDKARELVNRDKGETIYENNGVDNLWEVF